MSGRRIIGHLVSVSFGYLISVISNDAGLFHELLDSSSEQTGALAQQPRLSPPKVAAKRRFGGKN